jgi:phenylalanyl-tRNA synthetase beta chain
VRLFETASVYAQRVGDEATERRVLTMLADVRTVPGIGTGKAAENLQATLRLVRGTLEAVARTLGGPNARIELKPVSLSFGAADPSASAEVILHSATQTRTIGWLAPIAQKVQSQFGLEHAVVACEVELDPLIELFPPKVLVSALPAFPAIERDLSLIVDDATPWAKIESFVTSENPALMESLSFVTTYRGKPLDAGKKSVTLRMLFRDPGRTLKHDEVTPQMDKLIDAAKRELDAEVRTV